MAILCLIASLVIIVGYFELSEIDKVSHFDNHKRVIDISDATIDKRLSLDHETYNAIIEYGY